MELTSSVGSEKGVSQLETTVTIAEAGAGFCICACFSCIPWSGVILDEASVTPWFCSTSIGGDENFTISLGECPPSWYSFDANEHKAKESLKAKRIEDSLRVNSFGMYLSELLSIVDVMKDVTSISISFQEDREPNGITMVPPPSSSCGELLQFTPDSAHTLPASASPMARSPMCSELRMCWKLHDCVGNNFKCADLISARLSWSFAAFKSDKSNCTTLSTLLLSPPADDGAMNSRESQSP